ncbi:MAG: hypothetical protein CMO01_30670 [Thalassobius sp.]|nr:hypothetical protein [Thalassovita sp.]
MGKSFSQTLSKEEAIHIAQQLYEVEILSEKGRDSLLTTIQNNTFRRQKRSNYGDANKQFYPSQILEFLGTIFWFEYLYRSGFQAQSDYINQKFSSKTDSTQNESLINQGDAGYEEWAKNFRGFKLEAAIQSDESLPNNEGGFFWALPLPNKIEYGLIHDKRSVLGKHRLKTLNDLLSLGLIDQKVYDETRLLLLENKLITENYLLDHVRKKTSYDEDFNENKALEIDLINELNEKGIISNENREILLNSYNTDELKTAYGLLPYCKNTKIFDLTNYSNNPKKAYKQIFEEIKTVLPDFKFKNFRFEQEQINDEDEYSELIAEISFEVDSVLFKKLYKYYEKETFCVNTRFFDGINNWLAKKGEKVRLCFASKSNSYTYLNCDEFGLILLTEEEFNIWKNQNSDYSLFTQSFEYTFSPENIQSIIKEYEKIGLFTHLTQEEIAEANEKIAHREINSYLSILKCFPKTIAYLRQKSSKQNLTYTDLIKEFSEVSRGMFVPYNIKEIPDKNSEYHTTTFSYDLLGKHYEIKLTSLSHMIDSKFLYLINNSILENQIDGENHGCYYYEDIGGYLFLTKAQYQYLKVYQPELFGDFF